MAICGASGLAGAGWATSVKVAMLPARSKATVAPIQVTGSLKLSRCETGMRSNRMMSPARTPSCLKGEVLSIETTAGRVLASNVRPNVPADFGPKSHKTKPESATMHVATATARILARFATNPNCSLPVTVKRSQSGPVRENSPKCETTPF